ncbi:hypothetical protein HI850_006780 [bacterium SPL81]|nr:hypothetical protein [Acinetobacter baumannii]
MAKSILGSIYLDRMQVRVTDEIVDIWKSKYIDRVDFLELETIEDYLSSLSTGLPSRESETCPFSYPLLHTHALREAILCTYKGYALSRSVVRDLKSGQQTYPDISAYIANLFFARAICLFLGVWFSPVQVKNDFLLIDLFAKRITGDKYVSKIFNLKNFRMNHESFWKTLLALIKQTSGTDITMPLGSFANNTDYSKFAINRNHLQYKYHSWNFDDLMNDDAIETEWFTDYTRNFSLDFDQYQSHSHKLLIIELMDFINIFFRKIAVVDTLKTHLDNFEKQCLDYKGWI